MMYRVEKDSIGTKQVPVDAYYGVQSLRGSENFRITGQRLRAEFINSMAEIKKACAICNCAVGQLDGDIMQAICTACDDILEGKCIRSGANNQIGDHYFGIKHKRGPFHLQARYIQTVTGALQILQGPMGYAE